MFYTLYNIDNQLIRKGALVVPEQFTGIVEYSLPEGKQSYFSEKLSGFFGSRLWLYNDKPHRLDGPAFESNYGAKQWWFDGKQVTQEQHALLVDIMKLKGLT